MNELRESIIIPLVHFRGCRAYLAGLAEGVHGV